MKKLVYTLSIHLRDYMVLSNGLPTRPDLDAESTFDSTGFPYFPNKRFIGLLKESVIEVLEMKNSTESEISTFVNELFGAEGNVNPNLRMHVSDFYPEHSHSIIQERAKLFDDPEFIKTYFSETIQSTSIDKSKGVALDGSLRSFLALDHSKLMSFPFVGKLVINSPEELEEQNVEETINYALKNLRYAGSFRNRGFGKLNIIFNSEVREETHTPKSINQLENNNALSVTLTTLDPIIITTNKKDENIINSKEYIPGSKLLGLFAYMVSPESDEFNSLFIDGSTTFTDCFPSNTIQLPLAIHKEKYKSVFKPVNVLSNSQSVITRKLSGFVNNDGSKTEVIREVASHMSRPNRTAGRSLENSGAFYNYENIQPGQDFEGFIINSDSRMLKKLMSKADVNGEIIARIGKNKKGYGKVRIKLEPTTFEPQITLKAGINYIVLKSSLILLNEFGFPHPSLEKLAKAIDVDKYNISIEKSSTQIESIQRFNFQWKSRTDKITAYKRGSTFNISCKEEVKIPRFIGFDSHLGFGEIVSYTENEFNELLGRLEANFENSSIEEISDYSETQLTIELKNAYSNNLRLKNISNQAIQNALADTSKGEVKLSNSLIGRMRLILESDGVGISSFLKNKEEQGLGRELKSNDLFGKLTSPNNSVSIVIDENEEKIKLDSLEYKEYWTNYFATIRKLNKATK